MSIDISPIKPYKIELVSKNQNLLLKSDFPDKIKLLKLINVKIEQDKIIIDININEYCMVYFESEIETDKKLEINISDESKITEFGIICLFSDITINGTFPYLSIGGCGAFYPKIAIKTKSLNQININEADIDELIVDNLSQNTSIYFGVQCSIYQLDINQRLITVYTEEEKDKNINPYKNENMSINYYFVKHLKSRFGPNLTND